MRGYIYILFALLLTACGQKKSQTTSTDFNTSEEVLGLYIQSVNELQKETANLEKLAKEFSDTTAIKIAFQESRNRYKEIETLFEFFNPELGKKLNGPAIYKSDIHAPERVIPPSGFQVLEELIFPEFNLEGKEEIIQETRRINSRITIVNRDSEFMQLTDENIFEAIKGEFIRIGSLGLSAFDCPVTLNSIVETEHALKGVQGILSIYESDLSEEIRNSNQARFDEAFTFLKENNEFLSFPRLRFITEHLQPLYKQVFIVQKEAQIAENKFSTPVDYSNQTLFTNNFFDINFFAPNDNKLPNKPAIELGKSLFYDQRLSSTNDRSCATCHIPQKAFADGLPKSIAVNGSPVKRNSPTLLNAGFQQHQFYDSRVQLLETQIKDVIGNPDEMHGDFDNATIKISSETDSNDLT